MFTYLCIAIAAGLVAICTKDKISIAVVMLIEFAAHKFIFELLYLDFRADNSWFLYMMYAGLQIPAMYFLNRFKAASLIVFLVFINLIYNLATAMTRYHDTFINIYHAYDTIVDIIMVMELLFMGYMSRYVAKFYERRGVSDYMDSVFRVRWNNTCGAAI